jgi:hypothetical protein
MCRLLCIDASNRPKEIPKNKWLTKDHEYTAVWVTIHVNQNSIQGVQLAEINLDETCHPYESFRLSRFAINIEDLEEFIKLAQECSDIDVANLKELIESEIEIL